MKAQPMRRDGGTYTPCTPDEATHVQLNCPGPYPTRMMPVVWLGPGKGPARTGPLWKWDGDTDKPSLHPSILTVGSEEMPRCHSFVKDGEIRFLADCEHELAGHTVALLEIEP